MPRRQANSRARLCRRVHLLCTHVVLPQQAASSRSTVASTPPSTPHHLETRRAVPCGPRGLLAQEHVDDYVRDGFLVVSGLIPPAVLDAAVDCMWDVMNKENRQSWRGPPLEPRAQPLDRTSPSTWLGDWQGAFDHRFAMCTRSEQAKLTARRSPLQGCSPVHRSLLPSRPPTSTSHGSSRPQTPPPRCSQSHHTFQRNHH